MTGKDTIYQQPFEQISGFRFDRQVVEVFEDMINRSVPGYAAVVAMTGELASQFAQADSHIYDLGCSLGASSLAILQQDLPSGMQLHAIDTSPAMLEQAEKRLPASANQCGVKLDLELADICDIDFADTSFAVLNFTLQFVALEQRDELIKGLYDALLPGGALLLSEKIRLENPLSDQRIIDLHHNYKRAMGYSELEIAQKRASLEEVLIPETLQQHQQRLQQAGFNDIVPWYQCFNFASLLAIK